MAETLLTYTDMMANLVDNSTGEIGAQDIKDSLYSLQGAWAIMAKRNTSSQSIPTSSANKLTMNAGYEGRAFASTYSGSLDRITVPLAGDGTYLLNFGASFLSGAGSVSYGMKLIVYLNGVAHIGYGIQPTSSASNSSGSVEGYVGGSLIIPGLTDADYVELWAQSIDFSASVTEAFLHFSRVG